MKNFFLMLLIGSFLVGDNGIVVPEQQLVSIPSRAQVREIEPAIEHSSVSGSVEVVSYVEYNGVEQTKEASEASGFYSIITSTDI